MMRRMEGCEKACAASMSCASIPSVLNSARARVPAIAGPGSTLAPAPLVGGRLLVVGGLGAAGPPSPGLPGLNRFARRLMLDEMKPGDSVLVAAGGRRAPAAGGRP